MFTLMISLMLTMTVQAEEPSIEDLLHATDNVGRGEASHAIIEMAVKTARYERTMKMETWAKGAERSLIRILEPAKDAGVATLKVNENMWNYLPKVDRTMKIPAGMMSGSWMGSHFTNDDLVREVRLSEDYTWTVDSKPADNPEGAYIITLVPNPDVPVVWGKVVVRVLPDKIPLDVTYHDEDGVPARIMRFSEPTDFGIGPMPRIMTLEPTNKPGEFTRITYVSVNFSDEVPDQMFSMQSLKQ